MAIALLASVMAPGEYALAAEPQALAPGAIPAWTTNGEVVGARQGDLAVFLGIPFAAPPVGPLRLRPPQPHAPWAKPIDATALAAPCIQGAVPPLVSGSVPQSEDCLYLNVWAPLQGGARRPVMVWLYGGGFRGGTASVPYFNGTQIATQSGVIVVTLNYRLGPLGFLTLPALDAESPAHVSGNYGIEDQQAALQWVKRNIGAFGGDPDNVTLFGESAGAISVEYNLISPFSRGLFQRAIIESSINAAAAPTLAASESTAGAFVASTGCGQATDVAGCLRAAPASAFTTGAFSPVQDGAVIPQQPLTAIQAGQFQRVPTIMGSNHDEWTAYVWRVQAALGRPLTAADYTAQLQADYGASAAAVLAQYPVSAYPSPIQALAAAQTDSIVACPTEQTRRALANYVPTFGYEFNEANPVTGALLGPPETGLNYGDYHTVELAYVFDLTLGGTPLTGNDATLSGEMIDYWSNMAKSGDPNEGIAPPFWRGWPYDWREGRSARRAMPHWPRYEAAGRVQSVATPVTTESTFAQDHHCAFWIPLATH